MTAILSFGIKKALMKAKNTRPRKTSSPQPSPLVSAEKANW